MALSLGLTFCKLYYPLAVSVKSGIPVGLSNGDRVLCAGEGGSAAIPHASNGVYTVAAGAWTFETWEPTAIRIPQVEVGSDAGAASGLYRLVRIGAGTRVDRI